MLVLLRLEGDERVARMYREKLRLSRSKCCVITPPAHCIWVRAGKSDVDRKKYWDLFETLRWICLREEGRIAAIREQASAPGAPETVLRQLADLYTRHANVRGLSIEVRQKLNAVRPETIGQAVGISGVTPAAISLLLVYLKRVARGENKLAA